MDLTDYTNLVTSQFADKPKYMAFLGTLLQPLVDGNNAISALPSMLDIDTALGEQLDFLGQWIGLSRTLRVPITGVFFSLDTPGLGFDEGVIDGPGNSTAGLISMDDETYRQMLYLEIAANNWDGTLAGAEKILQAAFAMVPGTNIFIEDNFDMTITIGVTGTLPSALFQALLTGGYFNVRGAAVDIAGILIGPGPFFGLDIENYNIAGFDVGIIT